MDSIKTTYCALYKDGSFVEKSTLEEIDIVPVYNFLLQIDQELNSNSRKLRPITREGNLTIIHIGNFGIIDLGSLYSTRDGYWMSIKIFDFNKKSAYDYTAGSKTRMNIFKDDIFPLINKLNELGSWENYENQLKIKDLQKVNEELINKINSLEEKINQLESTAKESASQG